MKLRQATGHAGKRGKSTESRNQETCFLPSANVFSGYDGVCNGVPVSMPPCGGSASSVRRAEEGMQIFQYPEAGLPPISPCRMRWRRRRNSLVDSPPPFDSWPRLASTGAVGRRTETVYEVDLGALLWRSRRHTRFWRSCIGKPATQSTPVSGPGLATMG